MTIDDMILWGIWGIFCVDILGLAIFCREDILNAILRTLELLWGLFCRISDAVIEVREALRIRRIRTLRRRRARDKEKLVKLGAAREPRPSEMRPERFGPVERPCVPKEESLRNILLLLRRGSGR